MDGRWCPSRNAEEHSASFSTEGLGCGEEYVDVSWRRYLGGGILAVDGFDTAGAAGEEVGDAPRGSTRYWPGVGMGKVPGYKYE